jgi:tetratricopeptide (TPR) repeat protein
MRTILIVICSLLAPLAAAAQDVSADCPEKPGEEDAARALAGEWFAKAETLFKQKMFNAALGAFECSLKMAEHPNSYFNAAQTAKAAGKNARALELARRSVELGPDGPMAGKARDLIAELEPIVEAEQPVEEPVVEEPPPEAYELQEPEPEPEEDSATDLALPGYIALGVGGAFLVTGIALQGATGAAQSDSEETNDYSVFKDKKDKGQKLQKGAIACFVIGGLVAATGVVLVLLDDDEEAVGAEVALVPGPGGIVLEGSF